MSVLEKVDRTVFWLPLFSLAFAANSLFRSKEDDLEWPFFLGGGGGGSLLPSDEALPWLSLSPGEVGDVQSSWLLVCTSPVDLGLSPLLLFARKTTSLPVSSLVRSSSSASRGGVGGGDGVFLSPEERGEVGVSSSGEDGGEDWYINLLVGVHPSRVCFPDGGGNSWPGRASSKLGLTAALGLAISISAVTAWLGLVGPVWGTSVCWVWGDGITICEGLMGLLGLLSPLTACPSAESSTEDDSEWDLGLATPWSSSPWISLKCGAGWTNERYKNIPTQLDCKTVRIFAYSSTREQSNKRSGTRLKTESETEQRHYALPISLLTLRKNRLFCSLRHDWLTDRSCIWEIITTVGISSHQR